MKKLVSTILGHVYSVLYIEIEKRRVSIVHRQHWQALFIFRIYHLGEI